MTVPPVPQQPPRPDTIQRYLAERYLVEIAVTREEIESMWLKAQYSTADARLTGLSPDGKLKLAFDAQMQIASALLWARGLRTVQSDKSHHFRLIDSVRVFAREEGNTGLQRAMETLDSLRRDRSHAVYEHDLTLPEEAAAMMANLEVLQPLADEFLKALPGNLPTQQPPLTVPPITPRPLQRRERS